MSNMSTQGTTQEPNYAPVTFARPENGPGPSDEIPKADLIGALVAITLKGYDPERPTSYGRSECATLDLWVLDGPYGGTQETDRCFFGLLARQISALEVGHTGVGRIVAGGSESRPWTGITWSSADADYAAAEAAMKSASF